MKNIDLHNVKVWQFIVSSISIITAIVTLCSFFYKNHIESRNYTIKQLKAELRKKNRIVSDKASTYTTNITTDLTQNDREQLKKILELKEKKQNTTVQNFITVDSNSKLQQQVTTISNNVLKIQEALIKTEKVPKETKEQNKLVENIIKNQQQELDKQTKKILQLKEVQIQLQNKNIKQQEIIDSLQNNTKNMTKKEYRQHNNVLDNLTLKLKNLNKERIREKDYANKTINNLTLALKERDNKLQKLQQEIIKDLERAREAKKMLNNLLIEVENMKQYLQKINETRELEKKRTNKTINNLKAELTKRKQELDKLRKEQTTKTAHKPRIVSISSLIENLTKGNYIEMCDSIIMMGEIGDKRFLLHLKKFISTAPDDWAKQLAQDAIHRITKNK